MLLAIDFTLPLTDPVPKFLLILLIILAAPLILNRLKIPYLLGLIIAGAVIGPHGFNLVLRDSSIILSGTAGLLYIMFLAGLEIDMGDFRRNSGRSLAFGMYTFMIPMLIGTAAGVWALGFGMETSVLLASMFASHTLITYPIVSKLGITKNQAVVITVGGTVITDTLALLVLTVIVGMATGVADGMFWIKLVGSVTVFALLVLFLFPMISRSFFKLVHDNISQYIFVLVMLFFGAFLAEAAGIESIIGAFLAGLALNRLIPSSSPLMNRIEFVGNSIFIPFFLISVGMLIDYRVFFNSIETIKVGAVMIAVATIAKLTAAWLTQKTFRMSADQRRVIFGLSNSQAAATLAAVMVGYNVILGTDPDGAPIRLLNDSVLNGTILMILVTCTIASFATQKGAHNIAAEEGTSGNESTEGMEQHILIPVSNDETVDELVGLSLAAMPKNRKGNLYALNVIDAMSGDPGVKRSESLLSKAAKTAAAADTYLKKILRYDISIANAVTGVVHERNITDIVTGLHGVSDKTVPAIFSEHITKGFLDNTDVNIFVYRPAQPLSTIKRHRLIIPPLAEKEIGFGSLIERMRNILANTGGKVTVYAGKDTVDTVRKRMGRSVEATFTESDVWSDFMELLGSAGNDETLWMVLSRKDGLSYNKNMTAVLYHLSRNAAGRSIVLAYPAQASLGDSTRYLT